MQPGNSHQRWFAAAVCVLAAVSHAAAEEGVVRLSDGKNRPGVVRMNAGRPAALQATPSASGPVGPAYFAPNVGYGHFGYATTQVGHQRPGMPVYSPNPVRPYSGYIPPGNPYYQISQAAPQQFMPAPYADSAFTPDYSASGYVSGGCGTGDSYGYGCGDVGCGDVGCGDVGCGEGCCDSGRGGRRGCSGSGGCDDYCYGDGYSERMVTLFARATPDDGCSSWGCRWWRGQTENYLARNQRLSDTLFGWMVPSGCCGQGCAPIGKYHMVYADDPGYADGRDGGELYGAQGYGTHLSVPLAPNVRHSYNYSWGTPSSRITPMGQYNPGSGMAQQSVYQSW
ncbi:MAG: hypothetical protein R3C59_30725 [Planctomycetaceae bacterium]